MPGCSQPTGRRTVLMCRIVSLLAFRNLVLASDTSVFVTVCPDGSVVLDGKVMSIGEATAIVSRDKDATETWILEDESIL